MPNKPCTYESTTIFKILMPIRNINSLSKIEIDRTAASQNSAEFRIYPTFIKDALTPGENIFKIKINHNLPGIPVLIVEVEDVKPVLLVFHSCHELDKFYVNDKEWSFKCDHCNMISAYINIFPDNYTK